MPVNFSRRLNNLEKKLNLNVDVEQKMPYSYSVPPQDTRPVDEIIEEWIKSGKVKNYKMVFVLPQFEHDEDDDVKDLVGVDYPSGRIFTFVPE